MLQLQTCLVIVVLTITTCQSKQLNGQILGFQTVTEDQLTNEAKLNDFVKQLQRSDDYDRSGRSIDPYESKVNYHIRSNIQSHDGSAKLQPEPRGSVSCSKLLDLRGKVAFIAGVADSNGFGWAIAKALYGAGATVAVGTWAPLALRFEKMMSSGALDNDRLIDDGQNTCDGRRRMLEISKIYPMDAAYDKPDDISPELRNSRRFSSYPKKGVTISEVANSVVSDFGRIDILVHTIANGPEVSKPLLQTTRSGYLAAVSSSSYSFVSLISHFAPFMPRGGSALSLSYVASTKVIPGYGGGMSSSKAALESDIRTLSYEAGRLYGLRINAISAGPLKSRAAGAINGGSTGKSFIDSAIRYSETNSPIERSLTASDVADSALYLLSPMARAVTGTILYVDNGLHVMGVASDSMSLQPEM